MIKKFLVTGGTGFIGGFLVRRLVQSGHNVRVFDNDWRGNSDNIADVLPRVEMVQGDIRMPSSRNQWHRKLLQTPRSRS